MNYFKLKLLYTDGTQEEITVQRVSDLSSTKSKYFYYETPNDIHGKGTCIPKEKIQCFECICGVSK